jgi:putative FmdB family regulatory protein
MNLGLLRPEAYSTLPLYEYRCTQCGNRFEKIQGFNSEPEMVCPKCGGVLMRPLTAPALQFKGAGWYVNDYASKSASGDSSESKPADAKAASGTDTKPAAGESTAKAAESSSASPAPAPKASTPSSST